MKARIGLVSVLLAAPLAWSAPAHASATVARVDWTKTPPKAGSVEGDAAVVHGRAGGGTYTLITIERPPVGSSDYAIVGRVRAVDVAGVGYLEMWNVFADGSRYFTRGSLAGASRWRDFQLPFYLQGAAGPVRLEINVVLPGPGTVAVGPLALTTLGSSSGAWWSDRTAGLIGGVAGSVLGVLGGLIGILMSRGRARGVVLRIPPAAAIIGGALLVLGSVAIVGSQPYGVWYPLVLIGGMLMIVAFVVHRLARRAYTEAELRKMRALDRA